MSPDAAPAPAADDTAPPAVVLGPGSTVFDDLYALLRARRGGDPATSYSARLMTKGTDAILKKIGEEATEVMLAVKDADAGRDPGLDHTVRELADLCYHLLVLMAHHDIAPARVRAELHRRQGVSGLAEKAARPQELFSAAGA